MAKRKSYVTLGGGGRPRASWWKETLGTYYYSNQGEALQSATVTQTTTNVLDLVFPGSVSITTDGWSISTDGDALSITSVISGDGTSTPKFSLSRVIVPGEVITISYDPSQGDSSVLALTDFAVTNNVHIELIVPFTGAVVDETKGTITNPNSANIAITQNDALVFTRVTDTAVGTFVDYWESVLSFDKLVTMACTMVRTTGFSVTNLRAGLYVDDNNRIHCTNLSGTLRLVVVVGGVVSYNLDTTLATNTARLVKIIYRANNDIEFYHYTGGAWVQLGTTQNANIGASFKVRIATSSSSSDAANDVFNVDGLRVTDADYTTQLPESYFA